MACYEHLPIHFEKVVAGFSRYHKYTLGTELRNKSREILVLIVKANAAHDKQEQLLILRERLTRISCISASSIPPVSGSVDKLG